MSYFPNPSTIYIYIYKTAALDKWGEQGKQKP